MSSKSYSTRPSFSTPDRVVEYIKKCIEMDDANSLYQACKVAPSDFWKDYIFQDFREIQHSETLEAVFLQDEQVSSFPENSDAYKLGGHSERTRHLHIDLEKMDGCWFIKAIWKCR